MGQCCGLDACGSWNDQRRRRQVDIRHTLSLFCSSTHNSCSSTQTTEYSQCAYLNDRKHEYAGKSTITATLAGVIRHQIATFSRPLRLTTAGRTVTSCEYSHNNSMFAPATSRRTQLTTLQNLLAPEIFQFSTLTEIRETIDQHAKVHTWAPLKSFRRIVVSFFDIESAIQVRQALDGEQLMGYRIRVYFGMNTPLNPSDQHLALPKSDRLFFISPPPSPPMGWEMKPEDAPNKLVHAEDLAAALARLHANPHNEASSPTFDHGGSPITRRRTGSTTVVYHPEDHGDSPNLPAISVEDTTETPEPLTPIDAMEGIEGPIASQKAQGKTISTARPPVEFME